jgi:hypothetical protein
MSLKIASRLSDEPCSAIDQIVPRPNREPSEPTVGLLLSCEGLTLGAHALLQELCLAVGSARLAGLRAPPRLRPAGTSPRLLLRK